MKTVLVAEDSDLSRSFVTLALGDRADLRVLEARDGEEAWEHLGSTDVDLVLTDLNMPRLDGVELIERMREDPRLASIPVVMITTVGEVEERVRNAGPDAYLTKPVDARELVPILDRFLAAPASELVDVTCGVLLASSGAARDELESRLLDKLGIAVVCAETSLEAIGHVFLRSPDFAVVDLQLPENHGRQFVRQLRGSDAYESMHLFLLADARAQDDLAELGALGATRVIDVTEGATGTFVAVEETLLRRRSR